MVNNRTRAGVITSTGVVLVVLVLVLVVPGDGVSDNRHSGKPLRPLILKTAPGITKTSTRTRTTPVLVIRPTWYDY